jgi:hypothetical protein
MRLAVWSGCHCPRGARQMHFLRIRFDTEPTWPSASCVLLLGRRGGRFFPRSPERQDEFATLNSGLAHLVVVLFRLALLLFFAFFGLLGVVRMNPMHFEPMAIGSAGLITTIVVLSGVSRWYCLARDARSSSAFGTSGAPETAPVASPSPASASSACSSSSPLQSSASPLTTSLAASAAASTAQASDRGGDMNAAEAWGGAVEADKLDSSVVKAGEQAQDTRASREGAPWWHVSPAMERVLSRVKDDQVRHAIAACSGTFQLRKGVLATGR